MNNLSPHLTIHEMTKSTTARRLGIDNIPTSPEVTDNLLHFARHLFEPLRKMASEKRGQDTAIFINSGYRSPELNTQIGGSTRSQHCRGQAADLDIDGHYSDLTNADLFSIIKDHIEYDQLIWEFGDNNNPDWVHVSYNPGGNRGKTLVSYGENGKTKYKYYR